MVPLGMFASYALSIARRNRGFIAGSAAAFLWRMFAHLECPDMRAARFRGQGTLIILSFDPRAKPKQTQSDRTAADASLCKITDREIASWIWVFMARPRSYAAQARDSAGDAPRRSRAKDAA